MSVLAKESPEVLMEQTHKLYAVLHAGGQAFPEVGSDNEEVFILKHVADVTKELLQHLGVPPADKEPASIMQRIRCNINGLSSELAGTEISQSDQATLVDLISHMNRLNASVSHERAQFSPGCTLQ